MGGQVGRSHSLAVSPKSADDEQKLVLISDPGQDLDDELAYIMLRYMVDKRYVQVRGIIATLAPAFDRARLCRGTLDALGLHSVPVGIGNDGGDDNGFHKASTFEEWAHSYMPLAFSESAASLEPGRRLLYQIYAQAEFRSLTLVVIASMKDPALFLRDNEKLFLQKTKEVIVMGGVKEWEQGSTGSDSEVEIVLEPDSAHNNMFDIKAAQFFYRRCQELHVKLIVVTRWSAYPAKVPRTVYNDLASSGSSIGCRLRNAQRSGIQSLWTRAAAGLDDPCRKGLPPRCDRSWFLKTFCDGCGDPGYSGSESIWDLVTGFMQYDTIALLASVPQLRRCLFNPVEIPGLGGIRHLVIGRSQEEHNIVDPQALTKFLCHGYARGLELNHRPKTHLILLVQPMWNTRADELLACVMIRALYELGLVDCVGIIVSEGSADDGLASRCEPNAVCEHAEVIGWAMRILGMGHVPVLAAKEEGGDGPLKTVGEHLQKLYDQALPTGVTIVVAHRLGIVADFAGSQPETFCLKTQSVIVVGAAVIQENSDDTNDGIKEQVLVPDPASHLIASDLEAANRFFAELQRLGIQMVVISRHIAHACSLPRTLFDTLASHGGAFGTNLRDVQCQGILQLWEYVNAPTDQPAARGGLPARCDRAWFVSEFRPNGPPTNNDDVWNAIESFNVYCPLAILAAIPCILERINVQTVVTVKSTVHTVLGLTESDFEPHVLVQIRALMYQCLFKGIRLNASEFDLPDPPPIALNEHHGSWHYNPSEDALGWLRLRSPFGSPSVSRSSC